MKKILLSLTLLCVIMSLSAAVVSPQQAGQTATRFMVSKLSHARAQAPSAVRADLADEELEINALFDASDRQGQPYVYTVRFPEQGGAVLVSGDDRFVPVLGYSETGSFDEQDMPENMRLWLQGYIEAMQSLDTYRLSSASVSAASYAAIEPILTTTWNQSAPYNNLCPLDTDGKRSVTGCTATAMAQVVNYHIQHYNAPTAIVSQINAYVTEDHSLQVDAIPAGTPLPNRTLLLDSYEDSPTSAQEQAVAQLMLYCGASIEMNYTSKSSGAALRDVENALIDNFGFDRTVRCIARSDYSYAAWNELMYNELAASRPVAYSGHSSGGGHAFVLDGYDGDGLFHINWGWGGSSDGYFALSVLNPDDDDQIGASGSSDGYSGFQRAVIGVQITGQSVPAQPYQLHMTLKKIIADTVVFSAYNETGATHSFDYGIGYVQSDGRLTLLGKKYSYDNLDDNRGWSASKRPVPTDLTAANTTRRIVPISREKGTSTWYTNLDWNHHYVLAEYDAMGVPHLTLHPVVQLEGSGMCVPTNKYVNEKQQVQMTLTNRAEEFYGQLYLFVSKTSEKGDYKARRELTALANETQLIGFDWKPDELGTYHLWMATDDKGTDCLDSTEVTITVNPCKVGRSVVIVKCNLDNQDNTSLEEDDCVRSVNVYDSRLQGVVYFQKVTTENMDNFRFTIAYEQYDEATGTYVRLGDNGKHLISSFSMETTYYSTFSSGELQTGKTYRVRLEKLTMSGSFVSGREVMDDRYIIRLEAPSDIPAVLQDNGQGALPYKTVRDGHIYIIRADGAVFNAQGIRIQ